MQSSQKNNSAGGIGDRETYGRYSRLSTAVLREGAENNGLRFSPYPLASMRLGRGDRHRNRKDQRRELKIRHLWQKRRRPRASESDSYRGTSGKKPYHFQRPRPQTHAHSSCTCIRKWAFLYSDGPLLIQYTVLPCIFTAPTRFTRPGSRAKVKSIKSIPTALKEKKRLTPARRSLFLD